MTQPDSENNQACDLSNQNCIPCSGALPPATAEEIQVLKTQVPHWDVITEFAELRLQRTYHFLNFKEALAFTNSVGEIAELEGHHPVITTEWGQVTVTWWTHAIGGLHENDFIMAAKCDRILNHSSVATKKLPGAKPSSYPLKTNWVNFSFVV